MTTQTVSRLAKCKDCQTVTKVTRETRVCAGWLQEKVEAPVTNAFGDYGLWAESRSKVAAVACKSCGSKNTTSRKIVATHTDQECNEKCMGATGPACECSCDGANHGGNHS